MALKTFLFVLASSCVTFAALIEECPPKESTICGCTHSQTYGNYLRCSRISSLKALQDNLQALKGYSIETLFLFGVEVSPMPTDLFQGLHMRKLDLEQLEVDDASFGPGRSHFLGLESILKQLSISYSFKKKEPLLNLKLDHLHSLQKVNLNKNEIPEIGNDWFTNGPKDLTELTATKNEIIRLGDRAFASLRNLENLDLSDNHLRKISRFMLPVPARRLKSLNFGQNQIRVLDDDIFTGMQALRFVTIKNNFIHSLPEDTWLSALSKLMSLDLLGNPLRCDQDLKWICDQKYSAIKMKCALPVDKKDVSADRFCRK